MTDTNVVTLSVVPTPAVNENEYAALVKQGRAALKKQDDVNWELGELAIKVDKKYNEDKLGQYAKDIGVEKRHLMICRTTFQKWPEKNGRPFFWIAHVLNPHPQRAQIVAKNPSITFKEARDRMKAFNQRLADKAAKDAAISEPASSAIVDDDKGLNKGLYAVAVESKAAVKRALKYIEQGAVVDQKIMDAITDAVDAWKTLLDQAATAMEDQS